MLLLLLWKTENWEELSRTGATRISNREWAGKFVWNRTLMCKLTPAIDVAICDSQFFIFHLFANVVLIRNHIGMRVLESRRNARRHWSEVLAGHFAGKLQKSKLNFENSTNFLHCNLQVVSEDSKYRSSWIIQVECNQPIAWSGWLYTHFDLKMPNGGICNRVLLCYASLRATLHPTDSITSGCSMMGCRTCLHGYEVT